MHLHRRRAMRRIARRDSVFGRCGVFVVESNVVHPLNPVKIRYFVLTFCLLLVESNFTVENQFFW